MKHTKLKSHETRVDSRTNLDSLGLGSDNVLKRNVFLFVELKTDLNQRFQEQFLCHNYNCRFFFENSRVRSIHKPLVRTLKIVLENEQRNYVRTSKIKK